MNVKVWPLVSVSVTTRDVLPADPVFVVVTVQVMVPGAVWVEGEHDFVTDSPVDMT